MMVEGIREHQSNEKQPSSSSSSHLVLDMLLSIVDQENSHGYALLLLWASQSNAIPVGSSTTQFIYFSKQSDLHNNVAKLCTTLGGQSC